MRTDTEMLDSHGNKGSEGTAENFGEEGRVVCARRDDAIRADLGYLQIDGSVYQGGNDQDRPLSTTYFPEVILFCTIFVAQVGDQGEKGEDENGAAGRE